MSQEKASELFQWRNKLDDLECLPGEPGMDKGGSWQKLHRRLDKRFRKPATAWYWLAAASVIAIISILSFFSHNKKQEPIISQERSDPALPLRTTENSRTPGRDPVQSVGVPLQKRKLSKTRASRQSHKPPNRTHTEVAPVPVSDRLPITGNEIVQIHPVKVDTVAYAVTIPEKKLSIVHINELEESSVQPIDYAGVNPAGFRKGRLKKHRLSTVLLTRNASDDVVKIKLSPTN